MLEAFFVELYEYSTTIKLKMRLSSFTNIFSGIPTQRCHSEGNLFADSQ